MRNTGRLALAISSGLALSAGLLAPSSVAANDTDEAIMLILDASGSMRGRIDGDTKMAIAKARIGDVFGALPAGKAIGLMAYGHRRLGDCSDIETLVPVEAGAAGRVVDAVNALSPRGKTPLASTVLMAADELRFQERPATVVLVTDGIESCEGDPCALAGQLEAQGMAFTAHVVGFGLTDQEGAAVSCLADNTGGLYLAASDADALSDALTQVVSAPAAPAGEVAARDDFDGEGLSENWSVVRPDEELFIVEDGQLLTATGELGMPAYGEPNNIFTWDGPAPSGDFDLAIDFTSEMAQARKAHISIGFFEDDKNVVMAEIYRSGNSNNELFLRVLTARDGKREDQRLRFATGSCCPRAFDMDTVLKQMETKGGRLIFERRGRKVSARLVLNGWTPNDNSPAEFVSDEMIVLRLKGKPAIHAGTWGGPKQQSITFIDRFEVTTYE